MPSGARAQALALRRSSSRLPAGRNYVGRSREGNRSPMPALDQQLSHPVSGRGDRGRTTSESGIQCTRPSLAAYGVILRNPVYQHMRCWKGLFSRNFVGVPIDSRRATSVLLSNWARMSRNLLTPCKVQLDSNFLSFEELSAKPTSMRMFLTPTLLLIIILGNTYEYATSRSSNSSEAHTRHHGLACSK